MNWLPGLIRLRDLLAQIYPGKENTFRLVDAANLPKGNIAFDDAAVTNWHNILTESISRGKFVSLIDVCVQDSGSDRLKSAYQDYITEMQQAEGPVPDLRKVIEWKPVLGLSILSSLLIILAFLLYFGVIGRAPGASAKQSDGQRVTTRGPLQINFVGPEQIEQDDWINRLFLLQNSECNDQMGADQSIKCASIVVESKLQNNTGAFRWTLSHPNYEISGRGYRISTEGLIEPLEFRSSDRFMELRVLKGDKGDRLVAILKLSCRCDISEEGVKSSLQSTAD